MSPVGAYYVYHSSPVGIKFRGNEVGFEQDLFRFKSLTWVFCIEIKLQYTTSFTSARRISSPEPIHFVPPHLGFLDVSAAFESIRLASLSLILPVSCHFYRTFWILEEKTDISLGLYSISPDGRHGQCPLDTLMVRIICVVSFPGQSDGRNMILFK